ncbi:LysR family transcriptional regulator [Herbaspirillum lusitanum]|jgi:DNA-binding transcriptional LysR family regulator|uniref:LysR family transcriptional regulator n=1 Tax=Herbaspirillum lusitanum TaxID=213312 RepID=A0ABW9AEI7_9BURK
MFALAIETYLAVVRNGNLSRAAQELHLTQTTISKRLKALEEELGMVLIERGKGMRQLRMTHAGEEFCKIAEQWSLLSREARILKSQGPTLSLTVGAVDSLNVFVLPPVYQALHAQQRSLKIEIQTLHSNEMVEKIEKRQLDVAFSLQDRPSAQVDFSVFFSSPMVVLTPAAGAATAASARGRRKRNAWPDPADAVHPGELDPNEELFIPWAPPFNTWHDQWWNPLTPSRIKLDSGHLILSMMREPRQWAIVPLWIAQAAQRRGDYLIRPLSDTPPPYTCYRLTHKQPTSSTVRALKIFDQYCTAVFDGEAKAAGFLRG